MCLWSAPPEQRDAHIRAAWAQGLSSGDIAREMHTTRNAVSGRLGRLGLYKSNPNARRKQRIKLCPRPSAKRFIIRKHFVTRKRLSPEVIVSALTNLVEPPKPEVLPNSVGEAILWLTLKSCRYAYGDTRTNNFYFCSETKTAGSSYCAFHSKLCLNSSKPESAHGRQRPRY